MSSPSARRKLPSTPLLQATRDRLTEALAVADALGACCSIDILGSYCHGNGNSEHSGENFSDDAFEEAVEIARSCIDGAKPKTAFFVYEIFPFNILDSPQGIARLVRAVDRKQFGVHMDLVNLINCPIPCLCLWNIWKMSKSTTWRLHISGVSLVRKE